MRIYGELCEWTLARAHARSGTRSPSRALPGGVEAGPDDSRSYAEWLSQLLGADSDAGA